MTQHLLFLTHGPLAYMDAAFAAELARRRGLRAVAVVHGTNDRLRCEGTGAFETVVDLLDGFDPAQAESNHAANLAALAAFEERTGPGRTLARDLLSDRWVRRFSHAYAAEYAVHVLNVMERLFAACPPVACLGELTMLAYNLAQRLCGPERPFLMPIVARFYDRIYFEDDPLWRWDACREAYARFTQGGIPDDLRAIVEPLRIRIAEGTLKPPYFARRAWKRGPEPLLPKLTPRRLLNLDYWLNDVWRDGYRNPRLMRVPEVLPSGKLVRGAAHRWRLRHFGKVAGRELPRGLRIASYFMHYQPEYTVDVLGFPVSNQVELVRQIAASLPADMVLVVKEQPMNLGHRTRAYYDELAALPNVRLISDEVDSHEIVQRSSLVFTITGTVGLEAQCMGIPVVIFGRIAYETFEGVHRVENLWELPAVIRAVLARPAAGASPASAEAALAALYIASYPARYGDAERDPALLSPENRALLGEALERELERRGVLRPQAGRGDARATPSAAVARA